MVVKITCGLEFVFCGQKKVILFKISLVIQMWGVWRKCLMKRIYSLFAEFEFYINAGFSPDYPEIG